MMLSIIVHIILIDTIFSVMIIFKIWELVMAVSYCLLDLGLLTVLMHVTLFRFDRLVLPMFTLLLITKNDVRQFSNELSNHLISYATDPLQVVMASYFNIFHLTFLLCEDFPISAKFPTCHNALHALDSVTFPSMFAVCQYASSRMSVNVLCLVKVISHQVSFSQRHLD